MRAAHGATTKVKKAAQAGHQELQPRSGPPPLPGPRTARAERLGRRGPTKQQLVGRLTIEKMMLLWPWGPPQALPQYRYWELSISCQCANRSHRRKDCPVRGMIECHLCRRAHQPTGSLMHYCPECMEFWLARREYLARWAAENTPKGFLQGQLI